MNASFFCLEKAVVVQRSCLRKLFGVILCVVLPSDIHDKVRGDFSAVF